MGQFILSPTDSSATNATIYGNRVISDPTYRGAFTNAQYETPIVGQTHLISSNVAVYTTVSYGMRTGTNGAEIVFILLDSGTVTNLTPDTSQHVHTFSFYLPSQATNVMALPDAGQAPVLCIPGILTIDTRVPLLAPCTPPPPARPALNISPQPDHSLAIGWPASATGFTLKSTPGLPSTNWVAVPGVQSNRAVIQPTDPQQFYRLQKQ